MIAVRKSSRWKNGKIEHPEPDLYQGQASVAGAE